MGLLVQANRLGEIILSAIDISQPQERIGSVGIDDQGPFEQPLDRELVTRTRAAEGLGLPLHAGKLALFGTRQGRRVLLGEGRIDDHTIGEKVEIKVATVTGVRATQVHERRDGERGQGSDFTLTLTNDSRETQTVEIELPLEARAIGGGKLVKRDGWMLWRVRVPANGTAQLRYRIV
jgi:hypothetical protein